MGLKEAALAELDELIGRGVELAQSYRQHAAVTISNEDEWTIRSFVTEASATIDRLTGRDSQFYRQIIINPTVEARSSPEIVMSITGSLQALCKAVQKDHLLTLQQLAQAAVLDDFLAQASVLLSAGYHVAAMVLIGGVLEEHLAKLCANRGITVPGKGTVAAYNDKLKSVVFDVPTWRRIQAVTDYRNLAAHGKGGEVKATDVSEALAFTQRLLTEYAK
jgi:hypothetical protein